MWTILSYDMIQRLSHTPKSDMEYLRDIIRKNDFCKVSGYPTNIAFARYLQHGRDIGINTKMEYPPYYAENHGHFFKSKAGKIYNIYCPGCFTEAEIVRWAEREDLTVKIFEKSWYGEGTSMVVFSVKDDFLP